MIFGKNTKQYLLGGGIVLSALIILLLVVKYVPLDPTKIVVETVEEKIHFEVKPNLEIENIKPKDDMDSNKDVNLNLEPTDIRCKPSVHPGMTLFNPNSIGAPRA